MAKGTYRKKRLAVLEALEEHDAEWADQIRELRTSNPQAYRKELLKAEVLIAAKTGRKLTLSMRPKRFGGEEDPVLVRRVLALRKAHPELTRGFPMDPIFGRPTPEMEAGDRGGVEGWTQQRTPRAEEEPETAESFTQRRAPEPDVPDRGSVEGWTQFRTPDAENADLGSVDGWKQGRTPDVPKGEVGGEGHAPRGRAPEIAERPEEDPTAPMPETRRSRLREGEAEAPVRPRRAAPSQKAGAKAPVALPGADLSILGGTIGAFKKALATGEHDAHLDALETAERAGKGRKGVLSAIAARR